MAAILTTFALTIGTVKRVPFSLVSPVGFEPTIPRLGGERIIRLCYRDNFGADTRDRTEATTVRRGRVCPTLPALSLVVTVGVEPT
jgi:hypothetical protein